MVVQSAKGLNSRSEANPYNEDGFLPLITAPMYSVVDENNYQLFLNNGIQVCLPRNTQLESLEYENDLFFSYSLIRFVECYLKKNINSFPKKVCIDTANGNMPALHDAIRQAKDIHGNNITIMAGNVASVDAFIELAKTGCDYIRVGIGGGGGCNTTANTGIGQMNLQHLISACNRVRLNPREYNIYMPQTDTKEYINLQSVKIVADGISSYVEDCRTKYNYNDNGYAAINTLLFAGADLVMIGKLFSQCVESAGEKACFSNDNEILIQNNKDQQEILFKDKNCLFVKYSGMSTQEAQEKYQSVFKPSEGSVNWIPVRWTLNEWLHGAVNQDASPYLMGWVNSIKSSMAYTNKTKL